MRPRRKNGRTGIGSSHDRTTRRQDQTIVTA
jgi:hypothetical protein